MRQIKCPICGGKSTRYGKTKAGSQRWQCKDCNAVFTERIDNSTKQLQVFLKWLFGKGAQSEMCGRGRSFRRNTAKFWDIWPMPPKIEDARDVVFVDGLYIAKNACILICCDKEHVLGWYLCRYENARAWGALMSRIAEPVVVVSDGGTGFKKALKRIWPRAKHQRCVFHVFCQVKRYTTTKPKTLAGAELYMLAKKLLKVETHEDQAAWIEAFRVWMKKHEAFLNQVTLDEYGRETWTHDRLVKAKNSLVRLLQEKTLFTYVDSVSQEVHIPSTNNQIEGGINARLRAILRNHRGLSVERRIKAVYWWCYMHSPKPLPSSEILRVMPTDRSIADIYKRMTAKEQLEESIPMWGDAVVWNEFHRSDAFPVYWD